MVRGHQAAVEGASPVGCTGPARGPRRGGRASVWGGGQSVQDGGEDQGVQTTGSTSPGSGDQEGPWRVRAMRSDLCSRGLLWLLCSGETQEQEAR